MIRTTLALCPRRNALARAACKKQEGPQVAFLLSTLQEERYQKDVKYFEAHAKELGFRTVTLAADNDNAKQIAQVEDVLDAGREGPRHPADRLAGRVGLRQARAREGREGHRVRSRDRRARPRLLRLARQLPRRRAPGAGRARRRPATRASTSSSRARPVTRSRPRSRAATRTRSRRTSRAARSRSCSSRTTARGRRSRRSAPSRMRSPAAAASIDAILANNSGMARGAVQAVTSRRPRPRLHRRRRCRRRERQLRVPGQADDRGPQGHPAARDAPRPTSRSSSSTARTPAGSLVDRARRQERAGRRRSRRGRHARDREGARSSTPASSPPTSCRPARAAWPR